MAATDAFVAGVQAFAEAVRASANSPADAARLLGAMAQFDTAPVLGLSAIPAAMEATRAAVAATARRAALTSLARACAAYAPSSYDDAVAVRDAAAALFDAEVLAAADAGDRRCYLAFRALRTAVVADLTARGALLPRLTAVRRSAALPALALAQQLYQDATRAAGLVAGAGAAGAAAPSSSFMPLAFKALAT